MDIATLLGLIGGLAVIASSMAVALLTTLYGAVIANAVALPIAAKLKAISETERLNKLLALESVSGIQEGVNPRVLRQLLTTYLPENQREAAMKDA